MTGRKCNAKTRQGGKCGRPAGWGTDHVGVGACKLHAGSTPNGRKAAVAARIRTVVEALRIETPPGVTPVEAIERELARSALLVDAIRRKLVDHLAGDEGALVWGVVSQRREETDDGVKDIRVEQAVFSQWWVLYRDERAHMLRVAQALGTLVPADARLGDSEEAEKLAAQLLDPAGPLAKVLLLPSRSA